MPSLDDLGLTPQPICERDWLTISGGRKPPITNNPYTGEATTHELVNCALCGSFTNAGIWFPLDVTRVPYPYRRRS